MLRLRPHFAASNPGRGGHRYPPFVLTEYEVVMGASILNSDRVIAIRLDTHEDQIGELFDAVESLIEPNDAESKKRIGFVPESP